MDSQKYWMSFEAKAWVSPESGEILRASWRASNPPSEAGVSEFLWNVDFASPVKLAAHVPHASAREASFQVAFTSGRNRVDRNVTRFSEYRRFASDTTIHFGK